MKTTISSTSKSILVALVAAGLMAASAACVLAEDKTVTGEAACLKDHQTVISVQEGDRHVTYYLVENDVSKDFHRRICKKAAKVKATGEVKEAEGKKELTATKIELVKEAKEG
ncbi:MAG: hypothetical protein HY043_16425 [Verrucomicrobia bacterium]|nr:hypothetical protein [Verrucomicrobiota bacterium]